MTKIAILGAGGRMGKMLLECSATLDVEVVGITEVSTSPLLGQTWQSLTYTTAWPTEADVIIDFTFHTCVTENMKQAVANKQAYILGTTGLTDKEQATVNEAAKSIPIVQAPNMSLGVNMLLELVRQAADILDDSYDVEIVEMHHRLKKDAPSGTALGLAEAVAAGRKIKLEEKAIYGREGIIGERPCGEIGIHAVRGGSVVGDHTVIFAADEERVEITHKASSRAAFAKGALRAACWLSNKEPAIYTMRDVLGFTK